MAREGEDAADRETSLRGIPGEVPSRGRGDAGAVVPRVDLDQDVGPYAVRGHGGDPDR